MRYKCQNDVTIFSMTTKKKKLKFKWHIFSFLMSSGSDLPIHLAMFALMVYGTLMIGSASMGLAVSNPTYLVKTVGKQVVFVIAGYFGMCKFSNWFRLDRLKRSKFSIVIIGMEVLLLACLAFSASGGAHAWIRIPFPGIEMSIQPSEFAKIVSILIVAAYLGDVKKTYPRKRDLFIRPLSFIGIYLATVLFVQHDFGSMAVIFLIVCVCLLIPNNEQARPFQTVLRVLFWVMVGAAIFILSPLGTQLVEHMPFLSTYQKNRFLSAVNPFQDIYGSSYQIVKGLVSFADGGWFGVGFGNSVRKYTDFPAANTDFILAILVEELGFVGFLFLVILYGIIIFRLLSYANKIKNEKAKIILTGTAMYFVIHCFFNIGGVTGLIPLTGVPLLMISSGGSSTLSIMFAVGIAQAVISQYNRKEIE